MRRPCSLVIVLLVLAPAGPAAASSLMEAVGVDLPLVFDWDGAIRRTLQLADGTLVLDSDGRLAAQRAGPPDAAWIHGTLAGLVAPSSTGPVSSPESSTGPVSSAKPGSSPRP